MKRALDKREHIISKALSRLETLQDRKEAMEVAFLRDAAEEVRLYLSKIGGQRMGGHNGGTGGMRRTDRRLERRGREGGFEDDHYNNNNNNNSSFEFKGRRRARSASYSERGRR